MPSVVARALDNDPERLDLRCVGLLRYAEAKAAFDRSSKPEDRKGYDPKLMDRVETNTFRLGKERLARERGGG